MAVAWFFMKKNRKKILVTGGAGYIGSHTAKELSLAGYEPYVLDNFSTGHHWAVKWGEFIEADLLDKKGLIQFLEENKPEAIIHFAASSLVGESYKNPITYFNNNVIGTLNLLEAMQVAGIDNIVFSSSCAIYGIPNSSPIPDDHEANPISPYGESKHIIEKVLRWYSEIYNLKYIALRYFNAAGADPDNEIGEAHDPETHLIPLAVDVALGKKEYLDIYGVDYPTDDGTAVRDYVHVKDLAIAHVSAVSYLISGGESNNINLGSGIGYSVREIISEINKVSGNEITFYEKERRKGDPAILIADNNKAKTILNWEPKYSALNEIIKTAYNWHVSFDSLDK